MFSALLMTGLIGPGRALRHSYTVKFDLQLVDWVQLTNGNIETQTGKPGGPAKLPDHFLNFPLILCSGELQVEAPQGLFQEKPVSIAIGRLSPPRLGLPYGADDMSSCHVPTYIGLHLKLVFFSGHNSRVEHEIILVVEEYILTVIPFESLHPGESLPELEVTKPSSIERWQIKRLRIKELKAPEGMVLMDDRPFYPPSYEAKLAYDVIFYGIGSPFKCQMVSETSLAWGLDDYLYGYIPIVVHEYPRAERIDVPLGVSNIQVVWEAEAVYAGSMYVAKEQGPTVGPFLPQLDRINFKLTQYGLVLAVLFFGLGAIFELFKSYMWHD